MNVVVEVGVKAGFIRRVGVGADVVDVDVIVAEVGVYK